MDIKGRLCPRDCGHRLIDTKRGQFNPTSEVDGKQICTDCKVKEIYSKALDRRD